MPVRKESKDTLFWAVQLCTQENQCLVGRGLARVQNFPLHLSMNFVNRFDFRRNFAIFAAHFTDMYAIVNIAGRQYRVEENKPLVVNRLKAEAGQTLEFDQVLMIGGDKIKVGTPTVKGAKVTATVEEHGKGSKVIVFKKKRRKGYKKKNGHRDYLTRIIINSITA